MEDRQASFVWAAAMLADREARQPARLAAAAQYAQQNLADDLGETGDNFRALDTLWRAEVVRWSERQPVYQEHARRVLLGRPENIEPTAVLFW